MTRRELTLSAQTLLDQDGWDSVVVPFLFVPDGLEPDKLWLAAHPEWFSMPATLMRPAGASARPSTIVVASDASAPSPQTPLNRNILPVAQADDPQGLKMAAAAREGGLRTEKELRIFHNAITGQGIVDFQELVDIARIIKRTGGY